MGKERSVREKEGICREYMQREKMSREKYERKREHQGEKKSPFNKKLHLTGLGKLGKGEPRKVQWHVTVILVS